LGGGGFITFGVKRKSTSKIMLFTVLFHIKKYVKLNKYIKLNLELFGQNFENVPVEPFGSSKFYMQMIILKILT